MAKIISTGFITDKINGITVNTSLKCNSANYKNTTSRNISYLVAHYTGNSKDTAKANANYFNTGSRGASAHFFVDDSNIYQSVELRDVAWHCGANKYYHSACRNTNSIGVEMCCTAGNYKISEKTKTNSAYLFAHLCKMIGITSSQVDTYILRHYDVTHKKCPAQMVDSSAEWIAFKTKIKNILISQEKPVVKTPVNILVEKGVINSPDYWVSAQSKLKYLDSLLSSASKVVQPKDVASFKNVKDAINHLVKCGVINSPDYWAENYSKIKYLDTLLISMANHCVSRFTPYMIKITADALNIRKGAGTNYGIVGTIKKSDNGAYTIVDEVNGWGLLKSYSAKRDGWISLKYCKKI